MVNLKGVVLQSRPSRGPILTREGGQSQEEISPSRVREKHAVLQERAMPAHQLLCAGSQCVACSFGSRANGSAARTGWNQNPHAAIERVAKVSSPRSFSLRQVGEILGEREKFFLLRVATERDLEKGESNIYRLSCQC